MSKSQLIKVTLPNGMVVEGTQEQVSALVSQSSGAKSAKADKAPSITFHTFKGAPKGPDGKSKPLPSDAAAFRAAAVSGVDAEHVYFHASCAKWSTSAKSFALACKALGLSLS